MILKLAKTEREESKKDPLRATLAAAIESADAAEAGMGRRIQAVARGRALIAEREVTLADSVASIEKARGNEGRRTAAALAAGRAAPADDLMRSARTNALEAEDRLAAAQSALQRLEAELAEAEEEVRRRRQTVSVHIGEILANEAGRLLHRAHAVKKELGQLFATLSWLSSTKEAADWHPRPPEGLDVADLLELDERRAVFSDLAQPIANLLDAIGSTANPNLVGWVRWREALRHDADAAPPEAVTQ